MAHGPISIAEARRRVLGAATAPRPEPVALERALGRVLARDVAASADVPPFDPAAMDGFAVATGAEGELRVVGEARAGSPWGGMLESGTAVRISTGAPVPAGTGAVVPVERSDERAGTVVVPALPDGANVRRRGEDVRAGELVLAAGTVLGPAELGMLAALGIAAPECALRPRVAVLGTGDELVAPGSPLGPGQIWSSNSVALAAQVTEAGAVAVSAETVADEPAATRTAIAGALARADVVVLSGGVSVGEHDHVKGALASLGVAERFWGVAMRPGKPAWFGTGPQDQLVFGLPGNPVSAMVTFHLFARPALRAALGAPPLPPPAQARLTEPLGRLPGREQAVRVRLEPGDGAPLATPTGAQGSHRLSSMLGADALALIPAGEGELAAGALVAVEGLGVRALSSAP